MRRKSAHNIGELVRLIGNRWDILVALYNKPGMSIAELTDRLGKVRQQVHHELTQLHEKKLVIREKDKKSKRFVYYLSDPVTSIVGFIEKTFLAKEARPWIAELLIDSIKNGHFDCEFRKRCVDKFCEHACTNTKVLDSPTVIGFLMEIVEKEPVDGVMLYTKRNLLTMVIPEMAKNRRWYQWIMTRVVEELVKFCRKGEEWAIRALGNIAVNAADNTIKNRIADELIKLWSESEVEPNSDVEEAFFSVFQQLFSPMLYEKLKRKAKNEKFRDKTMRLLSYMLKIPFKNEKNRYTS